MEWSVSSDQSWNFPWYQIALALGKLVVSIIEGSFVRRADRRFGGEVSVP